MTEETVQIKRYPNRRFYALGTSRYVSLTDIEELIREGKTVQIRDSQTADDITRLVLTQIIIERHPDKISLFPSSMLHLMVRANDMMTDFLRDYFRNSLTYLEYLQRHGAVMEGMPQPMHWMKAWFQPPTPAQSGQLPNAPPPDPNDPLDLRVRELERRLKEFDHAAAEADEAAESHKG